MGSEEKKGTIKAIIIMMFSMLLSRGIGFARSMVLASQAGTGTDADAYAFSFLLPDLLNQLLAGGVLSVTFIPLFQSLSNDTERQNRFFSNLFWIGTVIFTAGIGITYALTPECIRLSAGKNIPHGEVFDLTVSLTRIILPAQLFFFWGAILNGVQYANKKFFMPSMTPVIYNIGIIVGGVALTPWIGIKGFSWGVVGGAFIGNVIMQVPSVVRMGIRIIPYVNFRDPMMKEWLFKTFPLVLTMGLAFSNELMGRIYGSRSPEGTGALAALNYSYRLFMMFVGIFGQAFAAGIYPFISKMATEKRYDDMETTFFSTLEKTAVLTLTASTLLFAVRYDLTALLFQRGSFTEESTRITAAALAAYLPGMYFFAGVLMTNRLFFALRQTYTTLIISVITLALTIPVYSTIGVKYGVVGIGLTGSLASFVTFALLLLRWRHIYPESKVNKFVLRTVHISIVAIIAGIAAILLGKLPLPDNHTVWAQAIRITIQTVPPLLLALVWFDRQKILPLRSLLRRRG